MALLSHQDQEAARAVGAELDQIATADKRQILACLAHRLDVLDGTIDAALGFILSYNYGRRAAEEAADWRRTFARNG